MTLTDQLPDGAEPDEVFAAFADWTAGQGFSLYPHQEEALIEIVSGANVILSAPLLGLFGNEDKYPTPEQVDLLEAELNRHGKEYEFYRYDGASHGFFYYFTRMYRPEATMDGWEKIFAFFRTHLAS